MERKGEEGQIKICVDDIFEEFDCPVCVCRLNDPFITVCGHSFCKVCIEECINLKHECPSCKRELNKEQIIHNYHLEQLLRMLEKEREKEVQSYFDKLAKDAIQRSASGNEKAANPIERVFLTNLRGSLMAFQEYYEGLRKEKDEFKNKVKAQFALKVLETNDEAEKKALVEERDEKVNASERKFEAALELLLASYEEHMKSIAPKPELVSVRVNVLLMQKKVEIPGFSLRPYETMRDLKRAVEEHFKQRGDALQSWGDGNVVIYGPLAMNREQFNEAEEEKGGLDQVVRVHDEEAPVQKLGLHAGSTVTFFGEVRLQSDMPKACITLNFDANAKKSFNYFSCKDCGSNWICEPCREECHRGHTIVTHLNNHVPNWACCYCMKKGICKIPNKRNPH